MIAAADFFTVEVWTKRGLVTHYVLFVVHHATRAVHIAGITTSPDADFMARAARNLTDHFDGFLREMKFLIIDRDTKFTAKLKKILEGAGVTITTTAFQAPNMNAIAERWVLSVKSECINRMIFVGEPMLRRALKEYGAHFHTERPHQGIGNKLIEPGDDDGSATGEVVETERPGGLLRSYRRTAA